ncbi:Zinc/iron permease [Calocera viscosa TUFC12733]|uniref:Zinc/iron permease n=1 Tax=Calocera viscosa (strain TUFC12733) TaxID=1330018 RepID=A0A167N5H6_CALVF|nr:Zinc/iron permease [Calocera viscosa TUFC12733]
MAEHVQLPVMRDPECPTDSVDSDVLLRVIALFVILFVSCFAAMFPTFAKRVSYLHIPPIAFFLGKHFGTGVIIATSFVHLLNKAYSALGDPCLNVKIDSHWPGTIVMISCLGIFLVEFCASSYVEHLASRPSVIDKFLQTPAANYRDDPMTTEPPAPEEELDAVRDGEPHIANSDPEDRERDTHYWDGYLHQHHAHGRKALTHQESAVQVLGVVVLQAGIMLHSIIIGLTLVVTSGPNFSSLLLAIIFHQLFEGLTLGVRLAALPLRRGSMIPYILAFTFAITTPIGIAAGLLGTSLNPRGPATLLMSGIMSAISAGVLIYSGCVELLAGDFLESHGVRDSSAQRQVLALGALFAGAGAMTVTGFWH